jgi:hypothetical protein
VELSTAFQRLEDLKGGWVRTSKLNSDARMDGKHPDDYVGVFTHILKLKDFGGTLFISSRWLSNSSKSSNNFLSNKVADC